MASSDEEDVSGSESDREEEKLDQIAPLQGTSAKKAGFFSGLTGLFGKKKQAAASSKKAAALQVPSSSSLLARHEAQQPISMSSQSGAGRSRLNDNLSSQLYQGSKMTWKSQNKYS
jgi:hypothetical protein